MSARRWLFSVGVLAALAPSFSACAHEAPEQEQREDAETILAPYLGIWRPTSAAEELNIGSLTITAEGLSLQTGASLKYQVERTMEGAVILRVTSHGPRDWFATTGALAFVRETVLTGYPANRPRDTLWIYWCESLDQLSGPLSRSACSKNGYRR